MKTMNVTHFKDSGKDKGTELGTETETQKKDLHEVVPV
jgi:hypothetical protein